MPIKHRGEAARAHVCVRCSLPTCLRVCMWVGWGRKGGERGREERAYR